MSELRKTTGAVAPALTKEQVLEFVKEPLKQLPAEWRLAVWDFWAYFEEQLKTQMALCTRIRRWRDFDGLTFEELQAAMNRMRSIGCETSLQFGNQVLEALRDEIRIVRKQAREIAKREWQGKRFSGFEATALKPEEIHELLQQIPR